MVKFPGGTPGRWEKIVHELGRSVSDVSVFGLHSAVKAVLSSSSPISSVQFSFIYT